VLNEACQFSTDRAENMIYGLDDPSSNKKVQIFSLLTFYKLFFVKKIVGKVFRKYIVNTRKKRFKKNLMAPKCPADIQMQLLRRPELLTRLLGLPKIEE
jgi:hypothetical protein